MLRKLLKSKIHRATVTEASPDYIGSITIDRELMEKADLWPGEQVLVSDLDNGNRLETYVLEGKPGSGTICMNGAAAHLIHQGDKIIIMAFALSETPIQPKKILVDEQNKFIRYLE